MKIIECPRDAMQGIHEFIPTEKKVKYINSLLRVGFDTIDFGSFVSPKAIPQMRDTADVLKQLDLNTSTKLLAIIANERGAEDACSFEEIQYLGFPFSVSETFQQRNTNSSIEESLKRVEQIQVMCVKHKKELVVYLSMAFGNPYGDKWESEIVFKWGDKIAQLGVKIISLADTIGVSDPQNIQYLLSNIIPALPGVEIGAHLHTTPDKWKEKLEATYSAGCKRFDSAIKGYGGCPMASDKLTGNMPTEHLITFFREKYVDLNLDLNEFETAMKIASDTFPSN